MELRPGWSDGRHGADRDHGWRPIAVGEGEAEGLQERRPFIQVASQGAGLPLSDALIATLAERRALDLLTLDAHFRHFEVRRIPIEG